MKTKGKVFEFVSEPCYKRGSVHRGCLHCDLDEWEMMREKKVFFSFTIDRSIRFFAICKWFSRKNLRLHFHKKPFYNLEHEKLNYRIDLNVKIISLWTFYDLRQRCMDSITNFFLLLSMRQTELLFSIGNHFFSISVRVLVPHMLSYRKWKRQLKMNR